MIITIGGVDYTKEQAIAHMSMPDKKDKTYTMFQALVAAKLNEEIGNNASCILETIRASDAWIAAYGLAVKGVKANSAAWKEGETLYLTLDQYTNGLLCVPPRD